MVQQRPDGKLIFMMPSPTQPQNVNNPTRNISPTIKSPNQVNSGPMNANNQVLQNPMALLNFQGKNVSNVGGQLGAQFTPMILQQPASTLNSGSG